MDWVIFAIGMVIGMLLFQFIKHFMVKGAGRLVVYIVIFLILFVIFSAIFINNASFKDMQVIKTGASIADVFTKNTGDIGKEGVSKSVGLFNSTFKKE